MLALKKSRNGVMSWAGGSSGGSSSRDKRLRLTRPQQPSTPSAARRRHITPRVYCVVGKAQVPRTSVRDGASHRASHRAAKTVTRQRKTVTRDEKASRGRHGRVTKWRN